MNEEIRSVPTSIIVRHLFGDAAVVGGILSLVEVCWTYLLPVLFPNRSYDLPLSTFVRYVLMVIFTNVVIMMLGAAFLGLLIMVIRIVWQRARLLGHWPVLIRFLLIAGAFSYFYIAIVNSYLKFRTSVVSLSVLMIGILLIILISIVVVWFLEILLRHSRRIALGAVYGLIIILICTIIPNYLVYRSTHTVDLDLPSLTSGRKPNILLVTLDTLRADHLACYGNKIVKTPVLDGLAVDGNLFESAFSQAPSTTPSHCSIMTSTYPGYHGARNGLSAMKLGIPTLAEILRHNGYNTWAFVSATPVRSTNTGLHRGFEYYEDSVSLYTTLFKNDEFQFMLISYLLAWMQNSRIPGNIVSNRAISWLDKHYQEQPFFGWLHYFDPHSPYSAPEPYKNMYEGRISPDLPLLRDRVGYAGEVTYTDMQLGRIIEYLKDKGLYDDMLIIVTSDHGEGFGEKHGDITEIAHSHYLYDTTQHIPLIIKMPGEKRAGQRIQDVVQLVDLAPTVLEYLGGSPPESFIGSSLLDLLNGQQRSEPGTAYAEREELYLGTWKLDDRRLMAIRTPDTKYICDATADWQVLYYLSYDPSEIINIINDKIGLAESCFENIHDTLGEAMETEVSDIDPKVLEQLRSLGYLGGDNDTK